MGRACLAPTPTRTGLSATSAQARCGPLRGVCAVPCAPRVRVDPERPPPLHIQAPKLALLRRRRAAPLILAPGGLSQPDRFCGV